MLHALTYCFGMSLFAAPGSTIIDEILRSTGRGSRRRLATLVPAYSIYNGIEDPPAPPIPTDLPVEEPIDVPLREPRDVPPPPEPERHAPPPTTEPHDPPPDTQSRSVL